MKRILKIQFYCCKLIFFLALMLALPSWAFADYYLSVANGSWGDPNIWGVWNETADTLVPPPNPPPSAGYILIRHAVGIPVGDVQSSFGTLEVQYWAELHVNGTFHNYGDLLIHPRLSIQTENPDSSVFHNDISGRILIYPEVGWGPAQINWNLNNNGSIYCYGAFMTGTFRNDGYLEVPDGGALEIQGLYSKCPGGNTYIGDNAILRIVFHVPCGTIGSPSSSNGSIHVGNGSTSPWDGSIHVGHGGRFLAPPIEFSGDTLENSGTVTCNPFTFVRSTPPQVLTGGGTISQLAVNGGNVQMIGPQSASSNLTLTSGTIELNNGDLNLRGGTLTGGTPSSYIVTNGTGKLIRRVGTSSVSFPVGTSVSYNPVSVKTQTGIDSFSVGVSEGIVPAVASPSVGVLRTWNISEGTPGGNGEITFTAQWNSGEEGSTFSRDSAQAWRYGSGQWGAQSEALTSITSGTTYPAVATIQTSSLSPWAIANAQAPSLIAPLILAFDSVTIGLPRTDSVLVRNNGWTMLDIDSVKSDNEQFTISPANATVPPFDSVEFQITFIPVGVGIQTGVVVFYSNMPTSRESVLVSGTGTFATLNVALASGWNLVSNPVSRDPGADSVVHLFPTASFNYAYSFEPDSGYRQRFTMANGKGYWEKFAAPDTSHIVGSPRSLDSIGVVEGWNLIGSISYPVDTAAITSEPPGIRASVWYCYDGTYAASLSLLPGKGYWIKASAAGTFMLNASVDVPSRPVERAQKDHITSADEFILTEKGGAKQLLYIEETPTPTGAMSELPPGGPEGTFDARFASQKSIESVNPSGGQTIVIRSSSYPVTLKWNLKEADGGYVLTDGVNGTLMVPKHISGKGELVITDPAITRLVLMKEQRVPHEFVLDQNYPNPFNPTTQIKFSVSNAGRATVEMFNILGQRVGTLFNENAEPGRYYTLNVNGSNMASGVYFYRLQSAARFETRKMMLLK